MDAKTFFSPSIYKRYLYCEEISNKLINFQNDGYLIFDNQGDMITGKFNLRKDFDYDCWDVLSEIGSETQMVLIDIEYWDVSGKPWIMSKKDMFDIFVKYRIVDPKSMKQVV